MIVIRRKEFALAIDHLMAALVGTATDGKGHKISLNLDFDKFGAAVLAVAGLQSHGEIPYLSAPGEEFPIKAFRPGDMSDPFLRTKRDGS